MLKNSLMAISALTLFVSSPAFADSISAEVRFSDIRDGNKPDATEYKVDYAAKLNSLFNYGAELTVKQGANEGAITSRVAARVGPRLPDVLGFHSEAYGEIGNNLKQSANFVFWGAGAKTKRQLYGPVSVLVGYRHREAFEGTSRLTENRIDGGLGFDAGSGNSIAVKYYRTTGTTRADAIGVSMNHNF